jgi:hypothetical protein
LSEETCKEGIRAIGFDNWKLLMDKATVREAFKLLNEVVEVIGSHITFCKDIQANVPLERLEDIRNKSLKVVSNPLYLNSKSSIIEGENEYE